MDLFIISRSYYEVSDNECFWTMPSVVVGYYYTDKISSFFVSVKMKQAQGPCGS